MFNRYITVLNRLNMIKPNLSFNATSVRRSSKKKVFIAGQASPCPLQSHVSWIPGTWTATGVEIYLGSGSKVEG